MSFREFNINPADPKSPLLAPKAGPQHAKMRADVSLPGGMTPRIVKTPDMGVMATQVGQSTMISLPAVSMTQIEFPELDPETRYRIHVARHPTAKAAARSLKACTPSANEEWSAARWNRFESYYKEW